jgi:hypothetical protein
VRLLYQGEATITCPDGGRVTATVAVWQDDDTLQTAWGGRAVVTDPDSLAAVAGSGCTLRWPIAGPVGMVGACRLDMVQVGGGVETYRMIGAGPLSVLADAD